MRVKIPLIKRAIMLTAVLSIIWSLQLFNEPMVLSTMSSLPPSYTPNMFIYNMEFSYGNTNYAATLSVILILITLVVTVLFIVFSSRLSSRGERRALSRGRPYLGVGGTVQSGGHRERAGGSEQ